MLDPPVRKARAPKSGERRRTCATSRPDGSHPGHDFGRPLPRLSSTRLMSSVSDSATQSSGVRLLATQSAARVADMDFGIPPAVQDAMITAFGLRHEQSRSHPLPKHSTWRQSGWLFPTSVPIKSGSPWLTTNRLYKPDSGTITEGRPRR